MQVSQQSHGHVVGFYATLATRVDQEEKIGLCNHDWDRWVSMGTDFQSLGPLFAPSWQCKFDGVDGTLSGSDGDDATEDMKLIYMLIRNFSAVKKRRKGEVLWFPYYHNNFSYVYRFLPKCQMCVSIRTVLNDKKSPPPNVMNVITLIMAAAPCPPSAAAV